MAPSNSANKVAKLASRGKGKRVRFQGGTLFPAIVVVVVIVMLALVVYARASRPTDGSGPPRLGDHWHAAYGFYVCDDTGGAFLPNLSGTAEETAIDSSGQTVIVNKNYRNTGIHSHDDGVIHYHPYTSRATGNRARLGVFLDTYGVTLTDTKLELPPEQGGNTYDTETYKCGGEDTQIRVRVWESFADSGNYKDYVTDFRNIRIDRNGMAMTIAVVPKGKDIPMPPSAPKLPELGQIDGGDAISVPSIVDPVEGTLSATTIAVDSTTPSGAATGSDGTDGVTTSAATSTSTG
ncbi:MAG: hypothetical protein QM733_09760 [Ilumatobacteraceae bacterium]